MKYQCIIKQLRFLALIIIIGTLSAMESQHTLPQVIECFERTKHGWEADFKQLYGVTDPRLMPEPNMSAVTLDLAQFYPKLRQEIEQFCKANGFAIEKDSVSLAYCSPEQATALTLLMPFDSRLSLLFQAARTGESRMAAALGQALSEKTKYADDARAAATWLEYAALANNDQAASLLANDPLIPLTISLVWAEKVEHAVLLHERIVKHLAQGRLAVTPVVMHKLDELTCQLGSTDRSRAYCYVIQAIDELVERDNIGAALALFKHGEQNFNVVVNSYWHAFGDYCLKKQDYQDAFTYYAKYLTGLKVLSNGFERFSECEPQIIQLLNSNALSDEQVATLTQLTTSFSPEQHAAIEKDRAEAILKELRTLPNKYGDCAPVMSSAGCSLSVLQYVFAELTTLTPAQKDEFQQLFDLRLSEVATWFLNYLKPLSRDPLRCVKLEQEYNIKNSLNILKKLLSAEQHREFQALLDGPLSPSAMKRDLADAIAQILLDPKITPEQVNQCRKWVMLFLGRRTIPDTQLIDLNTLLQAAYKKIRDKSK